MARVVVPATAADTAAATVAVATVAVISEAVGRVVVAATA